MQNRLFLLRLALDLTAAALLIAGLAYWWLGNLAHELIGSAMFLLVLVHNGFNRRWYGRIGRDSRQPRGLVAIGLNIVLIVAMATLLVTSLIVSRDVFAFIPGIGDLTAREIHILAAYWVVVLVGLHIGLNWRIAMNFLRNGLGVTGVSRMRTALLRAAAAMIAALGAFASFEMTLGSKLAMQPVLDMWDFGSETPKFFANFGLILGLYAVLAHYGAGLLQTARKPFPTHAEPGPSPQSRESA